MNKKAEYRYVGFARNFGSAQDLESQIIALSAVVNPRHLHIEAGEYSRNKSPTLDWMLKTLRSRDVVVIKNVFCLSLSHAMILKYLLQVEQDDAYLLLLDEGIDTRVAGHDTLLNEYKSYLRSKDEHRRLITMEGLKRASAVGRRGGRPRAVNELKLAEAREHLAAGRTMLDAASKVGLSRGSLYNAGLRCLPKKKKAAH